MVGNHSQSVKAQGSLTARPTSRAGTKVGLSDPTFVSARLVSLTVRQAYAIALYERFLTVLSLPSHASVTIWEATAPVKLPTIQCLDAG